MTQRERLIELLEIKQVYGIDQEQPRRNELQLIDNDELADFLLENGVIAPPLAIGLKVYQIDGERIYESRIINVVPKPTPFVYDTSGIAFDEDAIGNSVFLSYEAAEKALAEREKNDG